LKNVFCLCKIVYTCHMFLYLYLSLLFFKNKQITKKKIDDIYVEQELPTLPEHPVHPQF
jgi:hypothetical protein